MHTRAMGPGAGWSWLVRAVNLGRNNPRALFGAAALVMVVALVPSVLQLLAEFAFGVTNVSAVLAITLLGALAMLVVYPLLIGGFFRVIDATEHNRPTHATALFDAFRSGQGRGRLIGFGLLLAVIYLLALGGLVAGFGSEVPGWYMQVLAASQQATSGAAPALPAMPEGMGTVFGLGMLLMMFLGSVYSIGFGQVALSSRSVWGALADGISGTLKNLLPLLVLTLVALGAMLGLAIVLVLALGLLITLGNLVHPMVGVALVIPVYLAFLVAMYVVMFGVMYFIWRDVAGDTVSDPARDAGFEA